MAQDLDPLKAATTDAYGIADLTADDDDQVDEVQDDASLSKALGAIKTEPPKEPEKANLFYTTYAA